MNAKPIIFRKGEENGIVVERDHFENSIMLNQYQQAVDIFNRQWKQQYAIIDDFKKSNGRNNNIWIDNKFSNIIAFCGDRGEGKSSCMASFATILTDEEVRKNAVNAKVSYSLDSKEDSQKLFHGLEDLLSTDKIEWLDVIDPSFFDDKHNLLELLLGRISLKAQDKIKRGCESDCANTCSHRELMEQLQRVRKCISVMAPKKGDATVYDTVEDMSDLAAGLQLKTELQTLFKCYLKFVGKECLLICIDDLDLNISEGYAMAEMLRKYLINPYCVILVSVKVEQLIDVIATEHMKAVKDTSIKWENCQLMAQKYVAKLLPRGNRVVMPVADDFCERELQMADEQGVINQNEPIYIVKEKVVQMIFQKTGYVFYNTQHLSPIIPRNLRSLRHLLGLLYDLPDARDEKWEDNDTGKDAFKDYFFGTWAIQHLSEKDFSFARELAYYDDLSTMNAFVVEHFAKRVKEDEKIEIENTDIKDEFTNLYLNIVSKQNTASNISYGDVMYVLWLINGMSLKTDIQNLIFFIKAIYSMRLYACYNLISRSETDLCPPTSDVENVVSIHRADTLYEHVNQIQKLVNGSYFTYPQGVFLPKNEEKAVNRDKKPIPFDVIISGLKEISADYKNAETRKTEGFRKKLILFEILALCIARTATEKEQLEDKGYNRVDKVPAFLGAFSSSAKYAIFDFLLPFYSLCNIEYAYRRFDSILKETGNTNSFYEIAKKTKDSLLSKLLSLSKKKKEWEQKHYLISDAIIRITDVQWAIYDELLRTKNLHKNGDDSMLSAYGKIIDLKIKLFPLVRKNDTNHKAHILKFESIAKLSELIKEVGWDNLNKYLYIPRELIVQDDVNTFMNNFIAAVTLMPNRPISGAEIKKLILEEATLTEKQKASLTARLGHIFKAQEMYSKNYILNNGIAIQAIYKAAKKK